LNLFVFGILILAVLCGVKRVGSGAILSFFGTALAIYASLSLMIPWH
jgi:hypothetical protein